MKDTMQQLRYFGDFTSATRSLRSEEAVSVSVALGIFHSISHIILLSLVSSIEEETLPKTFDEFDFEMI